MVADEYVTAADLAESAALYRQLSDNGDHRHETEESWQPLTAQDFLGLPEPEGNELLGPLVLRGGRTIIGGDSGHGKTTLAYAMVAAIVTGGELLGYIGAKLGPALILDLEQGVRSIKRGLREAALAETETHVLNLPDGLSLDRNPVELLRLEELITVLEPTVVSLDPYYKAHRGDANEERGVTDLMRNLDRLRSDYGFALILPAHVRKDVQGGGVRKLTLADIAGSGAISRGAEVVLGLERLSHGQARLRYLKDREGELPVGEAIDLTYSQEEGFQVKEGPSGESIEGMILGTEDSGWMTTREWAKDLGLRHVETKRVLERLAVAGQIEFSIGPKGRAPTSKCYSTGGVPRLQEQSGTDGNTEASGVGVPTVPNPLRSRGVLGTPPEPLAGGPENAGADDDIPLP